MSDVFVSRADGVTRAPVALEGDAFAVPVPGGDADVELAIVSGTEFGPLARVRIGAGSSLFGTSGRVQGRERQGAGAAANCCARREGSSADLRAADCRGP
jgi:hypothetical protein